MGGSFLRLAVALVACLVMATPAQAAVTTHREEPQEPGDLPAQIVHSDAASDTITLRCAADGRLEVVGVGVTSFRCNDFFDLVVDAGDGNDTIDLSAMTQGPGNGRVAPVAFGNGGIDRLIGSRFADRLDGDNPGAILDNGGADTVYGGDGNDEIGAGAGRDLLYGQAGNDVITGGGDGDRMYGGPGNDGFSELADFPFLTRNNNDLIDGGPGKDHGFGGGGNDVMRGGPGNDYLDGQAGNDLLFGGTGRDYLRGGSGNDVLRGGPNLDQLLGGSGRNRLFQ
jgi:Ca2+-binding RTX toxin-like protein